MYYSILYSIMTCCTIRPILYDNPDTYSSILYDDSDTYYYILYDNLLYAGPLTTASYIYIYILIIIICIYIYIYIILNASARRGRRPGARQITMAQRNNHIIHISYLIALVASINICLSARYLSILKLFAMSVECNMMVLSISIEKVSNFRNAAVCPPSVAPGVIIYIYIYIERER